MHVTHRDQGSAIRSGTATEALSMWLAGEYQSGDEPAMLSVIRRETCTELSDTEIKDLVYETFDRGGDAALVLTRLRDADRRDAVKPQRLPPR